jgi:hypothetical protein
MRCPFCLAARTFAQSPSNVCFARVIALFAGTCDVDVSAFGGLRAEQVVNEASLQDIV